MAIKCFLELKYSVLCLLNLTDSTAYHHHIILITHVVIRTAVVSSPSKSVGVCRKRQIERHTLELEAFCDSRWQYLHYQPVKKYLHCQPVGQIWSSENGSATPPWPNTFPAVDLLWWCFGLVEGEMNKEHKLNLIRDLEIKIGRPSTFVTIAFLSGVPCTRVKFPRKVLWLKIVTSFWTTIDILSMCF